MRHTKMIGYAYPTSEIAKKCGMYQTGCFFIQEEITAKGRVRVVNHTRGYENPHDPACVEELRSTDGTVCPVSLKYHSGWYTQEIAQ